jgi:hypothetical protein
MITDFKAGMSIGSAISSFEDSLDVQINNQGIEGTGGITVFAKVIVDSFMHLFNIEGNRDEFSLVGEVAPSRDGSKSHLNTVLLQDGEAIGKFNATINDLGVVSYEKEIY